MYLDNNVWNELVAESPALTVNDLVAAFHAGDLAVVGSLEVLEEIMGAADRKPGKANLMRTTMKKLCGRRLLLPANRRHRLEMEAGGLLSPEARYLPPNIVTRALGLASNRWLTGRINAEVGRRKDQHFADDCAARDALLSEVEGLGKRIGDFERVVRSEAVADLARSIVADGPGHGLPMLDSGSVTYVRVPTLWLLAAASLARLTRAAGENRTVKASDNHDKLHAAAGAYYDLLVTNDAEFRATLDLIPDRPFAVVTTSELASSLRDSTIRDLVLPTSAADTCSDVRG